MPDQSGHLVLLPGWGFNGGIFTDLATMLVEHYKREVTILDLPGYGRNFRSIENFRDNYR